MKQRDVAGFVMLCSNSTEGECIERGLFGTTKEKGVTHITEGMTGFLYNFENGNLHGMFKSISNGQKDLVQEAWNGKYPWQVKVQRIHDSPPLKREMVENILSFGTEGFPYWYLNEQQVIALTRLFKGGEVEQPGKEMSEWDFRKRFSDALRAEDGHYVRSRAELVIDNWLYFHGIPHAYDPKLPIEENVYSDFYIPMGKCYIEFWGRDDSQYERNRKRKEKAYAASDKKLISIESRHLSNIGEVLKGELRKHLPKSFPLD